MHHHTNISSRHSYSNYHQPIISEAVGEEDDPMPTFEEFQGIIDKYLCNLSPKKRDKALVDHARYCLIQEVLKNPRNTSISTAQFRFWVKKMFQLQPGSFDLVCHDNKPVAMREQIYDILVTAHKETHHGGRDKTSAIVRNQYSWIPKELVARFVKQCPTCISRRSGNQSLSAYTSKTSSPKIEYTPPVTTSNYFYDAVNMAATAAAAAKTSTPALLYTPSSRTDSGMSTSPSTDRRSPSHYITSSPSPPKRPFFGQNGLFETDSFEKRQHVKLSAPDLTQQLQQSNYQYQDERLPFSFHRASQENCMNHYTTYTEQPSSYYNALIYHDSHAQTGSAFLSVNKITSGSRMEGTSANNNILSHQNTEPSL